MKAFLLKRPKQTNKHKGENRPIRLHELRPLFTIITTKHRVPKYRSISSNKDSSLLYDNFYKSETDRQSDKPKGKTI